MMKVLSKRCTGLIIFEVDSCNPNGDPDWDGAPRVPNGRLLVTSVSQKRKQRDLLVDHSSEHFKYLQELHGFEPERFHVFESLTRGFEGSSALESKEQALSILRKDTDAFLARYWDVRVFGTTCLDGDGDESGMDGEKGEKVRLKRQGPVTVQTAKSICPVLVNQLTITKKAPLRNKLLAKEQGDIAPGALKLVDHAVCVAPIVVNPTVVGQLGTTEEDIEVLKSTLRFQFSATSSSSRPAGSMQILHIWWAEHDNPLGSFNEYEFFRKLRPIKIGGTEVPSTKLEDYKCPQASELGFDFKVADLMREVR